MRVHMRVNICFMSLLGGGATPSPSSARQPVGGPDPELCMSSRPETLPLTEAVGLEAMLETD